jgi:hypothetical protein
VAAMSSHNAPSSGHTGLPSKRTTVESTSSPDTQKFHIIHPVVVNQKKRSSEPRSKW